MESEPLFYYNVFTTYTLLDSHQQHCCSTVTVATRQREGERSLHGPKSGGRKNRREQRKIGKRSRWYKHGRNEALISVPATLNSQLQKKYQKEIKQFQDRCGRKGGNWELQLRDCSRLLQKSDPFKPRQCERQECSNKYFLPFLSDPFGFGSWAPDP